jgi:hypothetical protein
MEHDDASLVRRFFRSATPTVLKKYLLPFEATLQSHAIEFCRRYRGIAILDVGCGGECYDQNTIGIDLRFANPRRPQSARLRGRHRTSLHRRML